MAIEGSGFRFHAELLEQRSSAFTALAERGFAWLSEFGSVDVDHGQYGLEVAETDLLRVALHEYDAGGRWAMLVNVRYRQAEDGACVQCELRQVLRDHGDHTGVVRAR